MNKKLVMDLSLKAYRETHDPAIMMFYVPDGFLDKLAELVVRECIDVVLDSDPSPKMVVHEPYRTIMNNIQEHFGVEK